VEQRWRRLPGTNCQGQQLVRRRTEFRKLQIGDDLIQPAGWKRPAGMAGAYSQDLRDRVINAVVIEG
jgi:hypothetical protein